LSLKSTSTSVTWPEIWLPTTTVEIALSVPVAEIATRMSPRSTSTVRQVPASTPASRCVRYHPPAPRATTTAMTAARGLRERRAAGLERWFIRDPDPAGVGRLNAPAGRWLTLGRGGEPQGHRGAEPGRALDHHRPAEAAGQPADDRQSQPTA